MKTDSTSYVKALVGCQRVLVLHSKERNLKMGNWLLKSGLVALVLGASIVGCGARMEIAKETILEQIDSVLGATDVKRKEIELSLVKFEQGIEVVRRAKITAEVKRDQMGRKMESLSDQIQRIDKTLTSLGTQLVKESEADSSGEKQESSKRSIDRLVRHRKDLSKQRQSFATVDKTLTTVHDSLAQRQAQYETRLAEINGMLSVIDAERIAFVTMKEAGQVMPSGDDSLALGLSKLTEDIDSLHSTIKIDLRMEEERWKEIEQQGNVDLVEDTLVNGQTTDDYLARIAEVTGSKQ